MKSSSQNNPLGIEPNDLLVVNQTESDAPGKKTILLRATLVKPEVVFAVVESLRHKSGTTVEVPISSVVLNLGDNPPPGKVYGHDLTYIFRRHREIGALGDVAFFTPVTKEQIASLKTAANEVEKLLNKKGLGFLLQAPIDYQVVSKEYAGKYSGMYRHAKDIEKHNHQIQVTLDHTRMESASIASYSYVLAHELGHALHFGWLKQNNKADAAWVRAYTKTVVAVELPLTTVASFLEVLLRTGSVAGARGEIAEDDMPAWKRVLNEVRTSSGLSPKEIDLLLEAERPKSVDKAWPITGMMMHELHPSVTQYALKSYKELLAESFAFWLLGKELPEHLEELVEKSVQYARSQN